MGGKRGRARKRGELRPPEFTRSLARSLFGRFILLCHYSSCGRCGEETGRKKEGNLEGIRVSVRDIRTQRERVRVVR